MRFSTVFSVLSCGAMALAAVVSPAALVRRSNDQIVGVLNTCGTQLDAAFVKLDACNAAACSTTIGNTVVSILDNTTATVSPLVGNATTPLAQALYPLVAKVSGKLNSHKVACNGTCGTLAVYATIDTSVSSLLDQTETSAPGVLKIVSANVVTAVVNALKALVFTGTLTTLDLN